MDMNIPLLTEQLLNNMRTVIMGKDNILRKVILCILCDGHLLLEDLPGTGKTTLAKALAASVDCSFRRIQFTPDLLPSDLTGIHFFDRKENQFVFRRGPVFTNILLGDEINRATPRTQSSLLECMEERQVTVDGETERLARPFLVIATQNPVEIQGTFPLPEAQLDRFFMRLSMGYPDKAYESAMLTEKQRSDPLEQLHSVVTRAELLRAQEAVRQIRVGEAVRGYMVDLVHATRVDSRIRMGISPRGTLALMRGAQAYAAMAGRDYVLPDDVKAVCPDILAHRLLCRGRSLTQENAVAVDILTHILDEVRVPVE